MPDTQTILDATCNRCNKDGHGTYLTKALCSNCSWEGQMRHSLTHVRGDIQRPCPRCQCRNTIRAGDFLDE